MGANKRMSLATRSEDMYDLKEKRKWPEKDEERNLILAGFKSSYILRTRWLSVGHGLPQPLPLTIIYPHSSTHPMFDRDQQPVD